MARILVFDSRYIDFEILTPASPNTVDGSLIEAPYYKTWRDKSCFRSLPDLLTKKAVLQADTRSTVFRKKAKA